MHTHIKVYSYFVKLHETFINIVYYIFKSVNTVSRTTFWYSISFFFHSVDSHEDKEFFLKLNPMFLLSIDER